jgi:hypothetical protein
MMRNSNLTEKEKLKLGFWAVILLFASIGNIAFYQQITIYRQFAMLMPFVVVVLLQFLSLVEIYLVAKG